MYKFEFVFLLKYLREVKYLATIYVFIIAKKLTLLYRNRKINKTFLTIERKLNNRKFNKHYLRKYLILKNLETPFVFRNFQ